MRKSAPFPLAIPLLVAIFMAACLASTQLQPALLKGLHAAGSFGLRPMSHQCIGLKVMGESITRPPAAAKCTADLRSALPSTYGRHCQIRFARPRQMLPGNTIDWLPAGKYRFTIGRFLIRYRVEEQVRPERIYCLGQDVWYGE